MLLYDEGIVHEPEPYMGCLAVDIYNYYAPYT